jgi:D-ribose pyranose/furanose isomerase RbsD
VYIGKTPTVGNFQVCDAISVVNGQAAYTLQVGGVNVAPESANHMLVSLNGILQKPGSSFTISGSTMTFASNLATGDVIDFVQILGNVLDIGQPSDDTVTAAKLNNDIISGTTALTSEPASTDELLISDAGTLKRIDYSLITNTPAFQATTSGSTTMANQTATKIAFASEVFDTDSAYDTSNSRFTPQTAGKYAITANIRFNSSTDFNDNILRIYKNGSSVVQHQQ